MELDPLAGEEPPGRPHVVAVPTMLFTDDPSSVGD